MFYTGERADCTNLAGKIVSLPQSGKKKVVNSDFTCLDLSGEQVDLAALYIHYP